MRLIRFNAEDSDIYINIDMINAIYTSEEGVTTIDTNGGKYWISEDINSVMKRIIRG